MADPLSIAASIIGIAAAGVKLSSTIYTFTDVALSANKHVKEIARDLSRTSTVITELGTLLSQDGGADLFSKQAFHAAKDTVLECDELFKEIQKELDKHLDYDGDDEVKRASRLRRLRWPLVEPKMQSLQARLGRLQTTLSLMLNIANCSRRMALNDTASSILDPDAQQRQIERLILLNEEANARYKGLERILHRRDSRSPGKAHPRRTPSISPSVAPSTDSCICGSSILSDSTAYSSNLSRTTTLASHASFHLSPDELESCTGTLRNLLSELEDAQSIHGAADQCETVREAYRRSLLSLEKIIPPHAVAPPLPPKKGRLHRMLFRRDSHGQQRI